MEFNKGEKMIIPLFIIYVFGLVGLLIHAHQHGNPQENYNFPVKIVSLAIELLLIWWAIGWRFI